MQGFLSHPLHLTQGRGQAQTNEELHIYVERALEQQNFWSLPSPHTCAIPFLSVEWEMWVSWHAWCSPAGCIFINVLSHHLPLTWELPVCLTAPGYLLPPLSSCAITLK